MTSSPVGRDRSDRPFAEIGDLALLLRHLETGAALSLIEHHLGRQDLGLERLNDQDLCVLMAPADDWKDEQDHEEGHIAVVGRFDWTGAEAKSLTGRDLAGPRVPGPRPDTTSATPPSPPQTGRHATTPKPLPTVRAL
ncbi:hypothetical protein [Streptomyces sp. DH1]|uniref:hypothetical protein n=1 Tax=Streptomyces sp. DH1 TaxID=2857012 RepID=UPI001E491E6D|nr:hypothetical protein [Streptomyces sp. DH1]